VRVVEAAAPVVVASQDTDTFFITNGGGQYNMFHRQDMHKMLLEAATSAKGEGTPCKVIIDHM
jgi:hypothetical protein